MTEDLTPAEKKHWLLRDKIPLWLHILTLAMTLLATVIIGPWLNSKFEQQKIKSAFVIDTLSNLNNLTTDLAVSVTKLNYCVAQSKSDCGDDLALSRQAVIRLQWKALEMSTVLDRPSDRKAVYNFQYSLDQVRASLDRQPSLSDSKALLTKMSAFTQSSILLVGDIANRVGLSVHPPRAT